MGLLYHQRHHCYLCYAENVFPASRDRYCLNKKPDCVTAETAMDLKQLRYFVRVAELGSFAKAADLLDVAQPTLSRQVRALEVDLKTSLFHRNGRGVLLTPLGARFLEQAHGVLHAAEASLQVLHDSERRYSGRVVCGMTPSVGRLLISPYVHRFQEELPGATLTVMNHLSTALHEHLRASRLDFAILHDPMPSPTLEITHLRDQALFVIGTRSLGPDADTVSMKALDNIPLVMPTGSHAVRKTIELAASRARIRLNVRFEVDVIESVFRLIQDGVGHTISTQIATQDLKLGKKLFVQRITSPSLTSELALVTPLQRSLTPLQARAAQLAKETFLALPYEPWPSPKRSVK